MHPREIRHSPGCIFFVKKSRYILYFSVNTYSEVIEVVGNLYISDYVTTGEYTFCISVDDSRRSIVTDVTMADSIRDLYQEDIFLEQVTICPIDTHSLKAILIEMMAIVHFRQDGVYYVYSPCLLGKSYVNGVLINLLIFEHSNGYTLVNPTTSIPYDEVNQIKEIYL